MKPIHMTNKEYARWLHETCCLPFDEACRMAGYSPEDDMRRQVWTFLVAVGGIGSLLTAIAYLPDAIALVSK